MKAKAVIEVTVVFSLTLLLVAALGVSPIGEWERRVTDCPFLEYALMIGLPLFLLAVGRRNPAEYGISLNKLKYQLDLLLSGTVDQATAGPVPFRFVPRLLRILESAGR